MKPNRYCLISKEKISSFAKNYKNLIKKYYGRKTIFVDKPVHFTAAINRSKYFLHFEVCDRAIPAYKFQSLANLIIFNTDIFLRYHWRGRYSPHACYPNIHPLKLKRALRSCKNPEPDDWIHPKHLENLFHLKSLTLHIENGLSMDKASKVIRKLRLLRSLHVKYLSDSDKGNPNFPMKSLTKSMISDPDDKRGWGVFYKISKLPRLQRFSLQTSFKTLEGQSSSVQQDFADFYLRSHGFKIETEVSGKKNLDIQELTAENIGSILKLADSLAIYMGVTKTAKKNPYMCQGPQKKRENLKQGKRSVKLYVLYKEKFRVNIGFLFTRSHNLASLYLKISGMEAFWDKDYGSLSSKLRCVVLDLDSFGLEYEILDERRPTSRFEIEEKTYEISGQRKVKFHSGLLELLKQLKTRAVGLKILTLFLCHENFKKSWLKPKSFKELYENMVEEKTREFFEELESFEKFHRIDLCKKDKKL